MGLGIKRTDQRIRWYLLDTVVTVVTVVTVDLVVAVDLELYY